jgi:hypothetical protein
MQVGAEGVLTPATSMEGKRWAAGRHRQHPWRAGTRMQVSAGAARCGSTAVASMVNEQQNVGAPASAGCRAGRLTCHGQDEAGLSRRVERKMGNRRGQENGSERFDRFLQAIWY